MDDIVSICAPRTLAGSPPADRWITNTKRPRKRTGAGMGLYLPVSWRAGSDSLSAEADLPPGKAGRILVVDDEPSIRDLAAAILGPAGYEVLPAETGEEACALLRIEGKSITLALLDIELPGMGGKQTFRRMRKIRPELPVMVSTGHGIEGQASEIPELGAAGFLGIRTDGGSVEIGAQCPVKIAGRRSGRCPRGTAPFSGGARRWPGRAGAKGRGPPRTPTRAGRFPSARRETRRARS